MVGDADRRLIRERAGRTCEYCQMPEQLSSTSFHVDHIVADSHGGADDVMNCAWSCALCNLSKGPNVGSLENDVAIRLYNPRTDAWASHFEWNGPTLEGKTAIGRVTILVLQIKIARNALRLEDCLWRAICISRRRLTNQTSSIWQS